MIEPALDELLKGMERYSREHDGVYAIPCDEGVFLNMLVRLQRPRRIIELGTSSGYSTIWLAAAARAVGARVDTVEYDEAKVELAEANFDRAGLSDLIAIHHSDAESFLESLENPVDFVFVDTEKKDYLNHFKLVFPKVASGGLVAADNAVDLADDMRDFLDYVKNLPAVQSVTVNIGNGLELTYKH